MESVVKLEALASSIKAGHAFAPVTMLPYKNVKHARVLQHRGRILEKSPKGGVCCEIGIDLGVFSQAIWKGLYPKKLHLIDIKPEFTANAERIFAKEIAEGKVEVHLGDSSTIMAAFPENYFDWVYIDANHTYDYVRQELSLCRTRVKPKGWIVLNDYIYWDHHVGEKYGVIEATNEFCIEHDYEMLYLAFHFTSFNDVVIRKIRPRTILRPYFFLKRVRRKLIGVA